MDRRLLVAVGLMSCLLAGCVTEQPIDDASDPGAVRRVVHGHVYLGCEDHQLRGVALDVPGPGKSTPEEAAAPFVADGSFTVMTSGAAERPLRRVGRHRAVEAVAYVQVFGTGELPVRVIRVEKRTNRWWPDAYAECDEPPPTMSY